jgi:hypothetical protein
MSSARWPMLLSALGIAAVSAIQFSAVKPTNFSGFDEWLVVDLAARGVVGVPYQHRPFSLVFFLPGSALWTHGLVGVKWVHWLYLVAVGILTYLVGRRLSRGNEALAFVAGLIAATWAPEDRLRLDVVLGRGYAGATACLLFAVLLLIESYRARRLVGLFLASLMAGAVVSSVEATAPIAIAATALLWQVEGSRRERLRWAGLFGLFVLAAGAWTAQPLLPGAAPSYQTSALGFDPNPLRVGARVLLLMRYHLEGLVTPNGSEILHPLVGWAALAFVVVFAVLWKISAPRWPRPLAGVVTCGAVGLVGAALGWVAFAMTGAIRTADRTQFLSAPGLGLFLASLAFLLAAKLPRPLGAVALATCGAWIVALGTGRTLTLQAEWDRVSYWQAQNDSLVQLTDLVPRTKDNTLLILLDESGAWPANFTFRHAVHYLYGDQAKGYVAGAHEQFLYPATFTPEGIRYLPWPVIREAWQAPATLHRYYETIVLRLAPDGRLAILDTWPEGALPALPLGAEYLPGARILRDGPLPASREILLRR